MLRGETENTNFIVFGLIQVGFESAIDRIGGEHPRHHFDFLYTNYNHVDVLHKSTKQSCYRPQQ